MKLPDRYLLAFVVKVIAGTPVDESFRQIVPLLEQTVTFGSNAASYPFSAGHLSGSRPMIAFPPSTSNDPRSYPEDFLMPTRSVDSVPLNFSDDRPIDRVSTHINIDHDDQPGIVHDNPSMKFDHAAGNFQPEHLPHPPSLEKNDFPASSTSGADFGSKWPDYIISHDAQTFPEGVTKYPDFSTVMTGTQTPESRGSHRRDLNPIEDGQHFKLCGSPGFDREVRLTPDKRREMSSSSKAGIVAWSQEPNIHGTINFRRLSTNFDKPHSTQLPPYHQFNQNGGSSTHDIKVSQKGFLKLGPQAFHEVSNRISTEKDVLSDGKNLRNVSGQSNEISGAYGKPLPPPKSLFERLLFDHQAFRNDEFSRVHGQDRFEAISVWLKLLRDAKQPHNSEYVLEILRRGFAHWQAEQRPGTRIRSERTLYISARAIISSRSSDALCRYKLQWLHYWSILTGEDLEIEFHTGIRTEAACQILIAFLFRVDMLATFTARLYLRAHDHIDVMKEALSSFREKEKTFDDVYKIGLRKTNSKRRRTSERGKPLFSFKKLNRIAWECFEYWFKNCERTYLQRLFLSENRLRRHFKGAVNDLTDFSVDIMNAYLVEFFSKIQVAESGSSLKSLNP